ncbi:hypothetical protein PILCRDRAFT_84244 [Piloderma croceum F 1598]|uniref:Uncharacterized protein n=1 Tax=Piloderma croceum (strain F 1598) TaxID=765440 RepID=A0A0C3CNG8_PILCF|nr:hypothetical protein PILCRDRAFT_84244 [Piloderma croceum F 1598]
MSSDKSSPDTAINARKCLGALQFGPRKKLLSTLLTNGILHIGELAEQPEDTFTHEERREHHVFQQLLQTVPGLEKRLMEGSSEDVAHVAELIQKGASSARADDTKSLKGAILDWITLRGQPLNPSLACNVKVDRGFHHERMGALLCPAGLDWSNIE